jgi:hypothetical protein
MSFSPTPGSALIPSCWSETTANFQVVWDSTSLGWLKECPAYYHYQMVLHWSHRTKGIHLMFGQLYATGVETYAKLRASGEDHHAATRGMVRTVLEAAGTRDKDGVWVPWNPPADHKDANIKNRYTLIRSLVWNVEDGLDSTFQTMVLANGKAAVELSFEFPAFEIQGEHIHFAGHMDSIVENRYSKDRFVRDDKTTKSALGSAYFKQYSPNNQMSLYSIAGAIILNRPVSGVLVKAAQIQVEGTRFATQQVTRNPQVLAEWMDDAEYWINQAKGFAIRGKWPRNDRACGNYGGCVFQQVCARSPNHRPAWLRDDYVQHVWDPSQSRDSN